MNANTYMQSVLWCCTSCGFVLEAGQPHMECPICEAYKSGFIDTPAHLESALRAEFGDGSTNAAEARRRRLEMLREGGYLRSFRLKGRVTEAVHEDGDSRHTL